MRWIARTALVLVLVLPTVGSVAVPVLADEHGNEHGADRLIDSPDLQGDEQPTVEERYPQSAYTVPNISDEGGFEQAAARATGNFWASLALSTAALIARGAGTMLQWAMDARLTSWMTDSLTEFVDGMADTVWAPLLLAMIVLGVAWIAWQTLARQRASLGLGGAVWMIGSVALVTVLIAQPGWFFGGLNDLSSRASSEIFAGIASIGTPDAGHPGESDYYGDDPPTYTTNTDAERAQRQSADHIWRVLVWEPWRSIVFANDRDANEHGERLLRDPSEETQKEIRDDLEEHYGEEDAYPVRHFAGDHYGTRVSIGSLAALAALATGIVLVVLAVAVVVLQFAALILTILAPLALLVGIHPGVGRTVTMQWFELWLGVWLKRVIITAVLALLVAIHGLIIEHTLELSWFVAATLLVVSAVAALMYRKPLTALLSRLSLASQPGRDAGQTMHQQRTRPAQTARAHSRPAKTAARYSTSGALAGVGGGLGAAAAVWRHRPRRNQSTAGATPSGHGRGGGPPPPPPNGSPSLGRGDHQPVAIGTGARAPAVGPPGGLPPPGDSHHAGNGNGASAMRLTDGALSGRGLAQRAPNGGLRITDAGRQRLTQLHARRTTPSTWSPRRRRYTPPFDPDGPRPGPPDAPWSRDAYQRSADRHLWIKPAPSSRNGRPR